MSRIYKVWWPDRGHTEDDATTVKAFSHESAASIWADWYDARYGDYVIVGGEDAEVMVLSESDDAPVSVVVYGHNERNYYGTAKA